LKTLNVVAFKHLLSVIVIIAHVALPHIYKHGLNTKLSALNFKGKLNLILLFNVGLSNVLNKVRLCSQTTLVLRRMLTCTSVLSAKTHVDMYISTNWHVSEPLSKAVKLFLDLWLPWTLTVTPLDRHRMKNLWYIRRNKQTDSNGLFQRSRTSGAHLFCLYNTLELFQNLVVSCLDIYWLYRQRSKSTSVQY